MHIQNEIPYANSDHIWRSKRMISYLRESEGKSLAEQREEISRFCHEHGLNVTAEYVDGVQPGVGLSQAMEALECADGLIVSDVGRFVDQNGNRARDIRPILHHFLADRAHKHLIAVEEGINTATPGGQTVAMEMINQLKDADEDSHSAWFTPHR